MHEDKRPPKFLAPLKALPTKLKAVKRLELKGSDSYNRKHTLTYIGPKTLILTSKDEDDKEALFYRTDGRTSLSRVPGKRPHRDKPGALPKTVEIPRLIAFLLGQSTLADYGLPAESDFERTYQITKKVEEKRAVFRLSYYGADSIGRSQNGVLTIDQKTGLPIGFEEEQSGNSPRDSGEYSLWEAWTIIAIR